MVTLLLILHRISNINIHRGNFFVLRGRVGSAANVQDTPLDVLHFVMLHDIVKLREFHDELEIFVFQKLEAVKGGDLLFLSFWRLGVNRLLPWTLWRRLGHFPP
jgi:hypothetical protein